MQKKPNPEIVRLGHWAPTLHRERRTVEGEVSLGPCHLPIVRWNSIAALKEIANVKPSVAIAHQCFDQNDRIEEFARFLGFSRTDGLRRIFAEGNFEPLMDQRVGCANAVAPSTSIVGCVILTPSFVGTSPVRALTIRVGQAQSGSRRHVAKIVRLREKSMQWPRLVLQQQHMRWAKVENHHKATIKPRSGPITNRGYERDERLASVSQRSGGQVVRTGWRRRAN